MSHECCKKHGHHYVHLPYHCRYIKLLKAETSSDSISRPSNKEPAELSVKKSAFEMEKTIFTLKRIIEKLQAENKRLKFSSKKNHLLINRVYNIIKILTLPIVSLYILLCIISSRMKCRGKQVPLRETSRFKDNTKSRRNA